MNKHVILLLLIHSFYIYSIYAQNFCKNLDCNSNRDRRSIDGSCNNIKWPWIGSANIPYRRFLQPVYDDNSGALKSKAKSGRKLPDPREVSLNCHFPKEGNGPLSLACVVLGQMITHDISGGASQRDGNGKIVDCSKDVNNPICINLKTLPRDTLNQDQPFIDILRTGATNLDYTCNSAIREQINAATSFLDLSVVYGSTADKARSVRSFKDGLMRTQSIIALTTSRPFLPQNSTGECIDEIIGRTCFASGEGRVNENLVLNGLQTLFVREHNRIAGIIKKLRGGSDEELFQEARRYVIAEYEHIIYHDWLPIIVGNELMEKYALKVADSNADFRNFVKPYDENVQAQLYNEFMGACFRWGHTMLQSNYAKKDKTFKTAKICNFNKITFNPTEAFLDHGIDGMVRGALTEPSSVYDPYITETLENHLNEISPTARIKRSSLSTVSIQRGRDHAFQPYLEYRKLCGLSVATRWEDLDMIPEHIENLRKTYDSVEDIELYPGGLSEKPVAGGIIGATFACITAWQFSDLKRGDRFFYESDFDVKDFAQIKKANFARLICDNVDVSSVTQNPFFPQSSSNRLVSCSSIPSIDFSKVSGKFCTGSNSNDTSGKKGGAFDSFFKDWSGK